MEEGPSPNEEDPSQLQMKREQSFLLTQKTRKTKKPTQKG